MNISKDIVQCVLKEITCPVCNEYSVNPIYMCKNGHNICKECSVKVYSCPVCRTGSIRNRNLGLEHVATKVDFPDHTKRKKCSSSDILEHKLCCQYILTACPIAEAEEELCPWYRMRGDLKTHTFWYSPNYIMVMTSEFIEYVLKTLTCPVCQEYTQSPIFMCRNGHNLCK